MHFLSVRRVILGSAAAAIGSLHAPVGAAARTTLTIPGRASAHVSIAAASNLVVAAFAATAASGAADIFAAVSVDGGRTFQAPVKVNDGDGDARVTGEQPPRVAIARRSGEPVVAVAWVSKIDGTTIRIALSSDQGRHFGRSQPVSTPGAKGNRGWHALASDPRGNFGVVWLDHRDMADGGGHQMDPATHGSHDGAAMAQRSAIYFARVTAGGVEPERKVAAGVCYCCKTALASSADGVFAVAWRQVYPGNIRDIAFARIATDGTVTGPTRVSDDGWQLDGCPDDGPAIAIDRAQRIHIVWPTLVQEHGEPTIALFHAMSADGRTFTPRQRVATDGRPHHPQLAVSPGGVVAMAWDELSGARRTIAGARGRVTSDVLARVDTAAHAAGIYPMISATNRGFIAAWTAGAPDASTITVEDWR